VLFLAVLCFFAGSDDREPAPRFHAKTLTGEQFTNDSVKGKVVLLQFWTTWCPYCRREQSLVDDINQEFLDKGLVVLAVDVGESKKKVKKYLEENPRSCRIVLTEDTNLAAMYAANAYPIYVAIDRDGYREPQQVVWCLPYMKAAAEEYILPDARSLSQGGKCTGMSGVSDTYGAG
jgi:thiol-disulfide isomerase/thioredoxin